jgi:hypothetical protein
MLKHETIELPFYDAALFNKLRSLLEKNASKEELSTAIGFDQETVSGFSAWLFAREVEFRNQLESDYSNLRAHSQVQENGVTVEDAAEYPPCPW